MKTSVQHTASLYPFIIGMVILAVAGAGYYFLVQPKRSVASFCSTYLAGKSRLLKQWSQQENQGSDDFSKFLGGFSTVAGEPNDLANFFGSLDRVAPTGIEPDIATMRDAFKKEADLMANTAGNIAGGNMLGGALQGIGSSLMLSFSSQGAFTRVNAYITNNCTAGQPLPSLK